jgi:hypothetical protein
MYQITHAGKGTIDDRHLPCLPVIDLATARDERPAEGLGGRMGFLGTERIEN